MNCKKIIPLLLLSLPAFALAMENHKAHEHGKVDFDITVDKKEMLIMMESPAQSILGFEKKIESKAEKEKVQIAQNKWLNQYKTFIDFPGIENCKTKDGKWSLEGSGGSHLEVKAEMTFSCSDMIKGKITIDPKAYSTSIEEAHFDFLGPNSKTKTGSVKKKQKIIIEL